jgi:uncharacterized membrane protein
MMEKKGMVPQGGQHMRAKTLRAQSWDMLKTSYWMVLVVTIIVGAVLSSSVALVGLILSGPVFVGQSTYLLDLWRTKNKGDSLDVLIEGFRKNVSNNVVAFILRTVFVFLWSLLFVIPGIIKALAYSQTFYVLADNPDMSATEAIDKSRELMRGHKLRLFWLNLSFIGWYLLGALALGVGTVFVIPYHQMTLANFYLELTGTKKPKATLLDDTEF